MARASEWAKKECRACDGEIDRVATDTARVILADLPGWTMNDTATELRREIRFKGYYEVMAFVNALAWVANQENHHPDLEVGYSRVVVRWSTHSVKGLSENDFICAAKTDRLLKLTED
jgi:4a-hydroxytetrahydrobiopterin dehydratase